MIYTFKSKAAGDLIMTEGVASRLMQLIGRPLTPMGAIEPASMPAAIAAIEAAIEAAIVHEGARPQGAHGDPDPADTNNDADGEAPVSLRQRAFPLLQMMQKASAQGVAVVWGV